MANHVSSLKRARQTERKTIVNRANKSKLRTALRSMREAIAAGDKKTLNGRLQEDRLRPRQERAEGRGPQEHRQPLQVPPQRPRQGRSHRRLSAREPQQYQGQPPKGWPFSFSTLRTVAFAASLRL